MSHTEATIIAVLVKAAVAAGCTAVAYPLGRLLETILGM